MIVSDYLEKRGQGARVYCIGESLLDIIFMNDQPKAATPGGSMLNTAVSLGRCGVPVTLISDLANDQPGQMILRFLKSNSVSTQYIRKYEKGKTTMALAFTDSENKVTYSFYKETPADRFPAELPEVAAGDIVLFGSFYSLTPEIREPMKKFLGKAKSSGAFLVYDPNFRSPHLPDLERVKPMIVENIGLSTIVKGSDEDFRLIFGANEFSTAYEAVKDAGCPNLIYTCGNLGVDAILNEQFYHLDAKSIEPVSTIGAGDAFSSGVIFSLFNAAGHLNLTDKHLLENGIEFSAEVCLNLENYLSIPFVNRMLHKTP